MTATPEFATEPRKGEITYNFESQEEGFSEEEGQARCRVVFTEVKHTVGALFLMCQAPY